MAGCRAQLTVTPCPSCQAMASPAAASWEPNPEPTLMALRVGHLLPGFACCLCPQHPLTDPRKVWPAPVAQTQRWQLQAWHRGDWWKSRWTRTQQWNTAPQGEAPRTAQKNPSSGIRPGLSAETLLEGEEWTRLEARLGFVWREEGVQNPKDKSGKYIHIYIFKLFEATQNENRFRFRLIGGILSCNSNNRSFS